MDYEKLHKDTINKLQQMVNSGKITVEIARGICADFVSESVDEKIRKEFIKLMRKMSNTIVENYTPVPISDFVAWLEKQGGHAKFINGIQVGDKVTRNEDGVLVNLSQLNRVAKKQGEQKFNNTDFSDLRTWKYIADYVVTKWCGIGQYLDNPRLTTIAEELQKKYYLEQKQSEQILANSEKTCKDEQKPIDEIQIGKKYKCIASPRYSAFMTGKIYKPEDKFLCGLMNFCSDCFEPIEDGEQKPADKVEPKFKVGDWVVDKNGIVRQILSYKDGVYKHTDGYSAEIFEDEWRLWDITKDAKDGDVLVSSSGKPFIFKGFFDNDPMAYGGLVADDSFWPASNSNWTTVYCKPATKEQRDLFFRKMKEAGYEWDAEKKELKKIEQNPAWSEEDINMFGSILSTLGICANNPQIPADVRSIHKKEESWFNELYHRAQPKQEWSEENEANINRVLYFLQGGGLLPGQREKLSNWLKSLRPQTTWKPSDEQIRVLQELCKYSEVANLTEKGVEILKSMYNDIKKLKG